MKIVYLLAILILAPLNVHAETVLTEPMLETLRALEKEITDGYAVAVLDGDSYIGIAEFENAPWENAKRGVAVIFFMSAWNRGMNNTQVLALLAEDQNDQNGKVSYRDIAHTTVGSKGVNAANLSGVSDGKIYIEGLESTVDDPMCCPSKPYKTTYELVNGQLQRGKIIYD